MHLKTRVTYMYKAIIVDDESLARSRLKSLLNDFQDKVQVINEFQNANDAYSFLKENHVDIVFLDISMPGLSGIELGEYLLEHQCFIVYITAHQEYSLKSFEHKTLDYLLKPISKERLSLTIEKLSLLKPANIKVQFKVGNTVNEVSIDDISCIIYEGQYCKYIVGPKEYLIQESLEQTLAKYKKFGFKQSHRAIIVNCKYISKIEKIADRKFEIELNDSKKSKLVLSRGFYKDFFITDQES